MTTIRTCTCQSTYQDARYGKQLRVHNEAKKAYRCTVCKAEKPK